MVTSLVTGGAGFIGSHVVDHLIRMGHKVVVLDDLSGGSEANIPFSDGKNDLIVGSITDSHNVGSLFEFYKPDYVFHLAAYAAEGLSPHIRRFNYENNLIGSVNLINAAVNAGTVKRFVFASSIAVYGTARLPWTEERATRPIDPYGIAKYAVELDLKAAQSSFGLQYTIFRPHNVFGERQNLSDPYRNVIGIFMRACLRGEPMTIFGDGEQTRSFTYIDDVAPHIAHSINMGACIDQTINIGSDVFCTVSELARLVADAMGVKTNIKFTPRRHELDHAYANHDRFIKFFGEREHVTLSDGLARMAAWAKTQTLREPRVFEGIEIAKGLPEAWRSLVHEG